MNSICRRVATERQRSDILQDQTQSTDAAKDYISGCMEHKHRSVIYYEKIIKSLIIKSYIPCFNKLNRVGIGELSLILRKHGDILVACEIDIKQCLIRYDFCIFFCIYT